MNKETIRKQEQSNDGKSLFLYYDRYAGGYLAFGLSAYYTTLVTEPFISYSIEMQMPVALLRKEHILFLRQSMENVDHTERCYYKFRLKQTVGKEGYERWLKKVTEVR